MPPVTSQVHNNGAPRMSFCPFVNGFCGMSSFGGRIPDLENVLVDDFLSYKSHTCFFLSHCHSDHMSGLDQLFLDISNSDDRYLYCSPISRLILLNKYKIAKGHFIRELTSAKVITVPANAAAPSYKVTVTPIPAGHCPGSIMFLFETVNASILYTGDFRILKGDTAKFKCFHSKHSVKPIDKLYFDATFLNDVFWEFPSRSESVMELVRIAMNWIKKSPQHNLLLQTSACYGYEYVISELGRKLNCKIHVKDYLHDVFWNVPEVGCFMTKDCRSTKVHVVGMFDKKCVPVDDEKLLRIRLSAQWYKSTKRNKRDKIWEEVSKGKIFLCYSNHCSCSELVDFLNHLQPVSLEPFCVAVGSTEEDTKAHIEELLWSWSRQKSESPAKEGSDFPLEKNYKFRIKFPESEENGIVEDEMEFSQEKRMKLLDGVNTPITHTVHSVFPFQVNISTVWFLPEEGFPVFYRFFEDKLTWNEARAACGSHHADLLSVQTSDQTDVARAYLKELDVADSVWIGLQRGESPEDTFSWTNGEKLLGDGDWVEPVPRSMEELCVAVEPTADFRWTSHFCGGPSVASFVCELGVPEWARKENGCLMSGLPSLTVTLMAEAGVIQLLSDCGLDGTRRVACNEKANRDEIIKQLSCDVDAFSSTALTTGGATRQINAQSSSDKQSNPQHTTRSYHALTRHRRSLPSTSTTAPASNNYPSHVFPHSPYLASERNAPSTTRPPRPPPSSYKPLPVIVITNEDSTPTNDSLSSPSPDNPPIVLMIDNKNLDGPFLYPLADDIIINNPSLSPLEIISVDLVELDNVTTNTTTNLTTPHTPPDPPAPITSLRSQPPLPPTAEGQLLNTEQVEAEGKTDVPQRRSRGRLFIHHTQNSYPRLLNRLMG